MASASLSRPSDGALVGLEAPAHLGVGGSRRLPGVGLGDALVCGGRSVEYLGQVGEVGLGSNGVALAVDEGAGVAAAPV